MNGISKINPGRNLKVFVHFLGANNGVVTGSATVVTIVRNNVTKNILVDYGSFQGEHEHINQERFIVGDDIDCVLLTHAHLDHCGGIPALFRPLGEVIPYTGKVYGSRETLNQTVHILRDSAKIYENKLKGLKNEMDRTKETLQKTKERRTREKARPAEIASIDSAVEVIEDEEDILYSIEDVEEAIKHFVPVDVKVFGNEDITLFEGIDAKFIPSPHINGACMIELTAHLGDERFTIVFTGDIGKSDTLLYRKMRFPVNNDANCMIMESLHGDGPEIETLDESILKLKKILKKAQKKQKSVIIPLFAMDRSAGFIKLFNQFMDQGMYLQCFIDSPLAMKELNCYINSYEEGSAWFKYLDGFPFKLDRFQVIEDYSQHMLAVKFRGPNVFITSSCMGYGGRVGEYFEQHIQDEDAIFIFPGFLPNECPSKELLEAEKGSIVEINDRRYIKHCETIQLHGFSSHGYIDEKIKVLQSYPNVKTIFLNHGDEASINGTYEEIKNFSLQYENKIREIVVPKFDDIFELY